MSKQMLLALWLPLIALLFTNCKKSSNEPSGPYQVRNYDGGYQSAAAIDGVEFVPKGDRSWFSSIDAVSASTRNIMGTSETDWLFAANYVDNSSSYIKSISGYIRNFKGVGRYILNTTTNPYPLPRPFSYGRYQDNSINISLPSSDFMTNNNDSGYIDCISYDATIKEFRWNFISRNTTDVLKSKTITGTVKY